MKKIAGSIVGVVAAIAFLVPSTVTAADAPSRIVVEYMNAANGGDFEKAAMYWGPTRFAEITTRQGGFKAYWDGWKEWKEGVAFEGVEVTGSEPNEVQKKTTVSFTVYFKDATDWKCRALFGDEGGGWKIENVEILSVSEESTTPVPGV